MHGTWHWSCTGDDCDPNAPVGVHRNKLNSHIVEINKFSLANQINCVRFLSVSRSILNGKWQPSLTLYIQLVASIMSVFAALIKGTAVGTPCFNK